MQLGLLDGQAALFDVCHWPAAGVLVVTEGQLLGTAKELLVAPTLP
jgi:hypothetical protein